MTLLSDELRDLRDQIARWVGDRLSSRATALDEAGVFPRELFSDLAALGYLRLMYPQPGESAELPPACTGFVALCEELARGSMGFAAGVCVHGSAATRSLYRSGSAAIKEQYFEPAMRGLKIGAFAVAEPDVNHGGPLRTKAVKVDGGWIINGVKTFVINGAAADFVTVAATTQPGKGVKPVGMFLVDAAMPGFSVGRRQERFAINCSETAELVFENIFVSNEHCLQSAAATGAAEVSHSLVLERIFTAALALGNAQAAYDMALQFARGRTQSRHASGKFQAVQFKLVDMRAKLDQARLYTYHAASLVDAGKPFATEAALAKIVAGDGCNEVCRLAMSVLSEYGVMDDYPAQRFLLDSHFPLVGGGTSDNLRSIVARQLGL